MKVTDRCYRATGHNCFICDFSPPRSGDVTLLDRDCPDADFIAVAYNPGRAVRTNSAMLAVAVQRRMGIDATFTLATRDMNRLALQSQLLGAQMLGLENVIVVQGDPFSPTDLARTRAVDDLTATGLISGIRALNSGLDFRGSRLQAPTNFCIGASVDLGRGLESEARLAHRKVSAGAEFLITQPVFSVSQAGEFSRAFRAAAGEELNLPVFFGLQILEQDGVIFSSVPQEVREELDRGKPGLELALELYQSFQQAGLHDVYLVPPIRRGGARGYGAAREFLTQAARV